MLRNINLNRWISLKKNIICFEIVKNPSLQRDYCSIFTNAKTLPSANYQQLLALDLTRQSQIYFVKSMSNENTTQTDIKPKYTNRLAETKSPYLLQHANNPVDWYPWGSEAIEKARKENKLIFLSVGYSTCHWCHVMEHESFENEGVAKIMNEHFVNIKVDREERPDIDKLYMNFLLMVNGSGGWPMSVWLTPDLAPIAAGTYFPPKDRYGMPSFETVLKSIAHKWNTNQEQLKATGLEVISEIKKSLSERQMDTTFEEGSADEKLKEAISIYKQRFDKQYGGFGSKPKFPEVPRINFLFHAFIITKDIDVLEISLRTLQNIGKGGIHDHIIGGFARYAVDQNWHIPHFEKMLYDQGQLLSAYSNAFKLTADPQYLEIAEKIFTYSINDLRHPDGAFYAGEDADSLPNFSETKKIEGAFYAWNWDEIKDIILKNGSISSIESGRVFEIYAYYYGLKLDGNVHPSSDPQGHLHKKNILYVSNTVEKTLKKFTITSQQLTSILNSTNEKLLEVRKLRPRPHLDTKVICSWNGLMLSGLSKLISCGSKNKKEHLKTAEELCRFVKQNMFDMQKQQLRRTWYGRSEGEKLMTDERDDSIYGFLDDYAFWIKGLLDFYKISLDDSILEWAKQLQDIQDKLFWDDLHGGYFYSQENSDHVAVRLKEDHDGAEPCGNSVAAHNLLLMSHYFDDSNYRERAVKLFNFFSDQHPFGYALPEMMTAFLLHEHGTDLVAIVGPEAETTDRFIEICQKFYVPGMVIVRVDPNKPSHIYSKKLQDKFKMVNNKPTVYICHNKVCRMPIVNPENLEKILLENFCHPKF